MAAHDIIETTSEDELGCLSYCLELESSTASRETAAALLASQQQQQHNTPVTAAVDRSLPTPLYFCLSPTCMTPSESAADHSAICSRLSVSGTLCDYDHESEAAMSIVDYPLEKHPLLDGVRADDEDLESQICDRSLPLRRRRWLEEERRELDWYQATLRFLAERPRDSMLVLLGLFIALVALVALTLLVFLMVMDARGDLGSVVAAVDRWSIYVHDGVRNVLQAFGGLDPTNPKLLSVTR